MKIKQTIIALCFVVATLSIVPLAAQNVYAEPRETGGRVILAASKCGDADTAIISCNAGNGTSAKDSAIWQVLLLVLNILTAGVGILAVGGIAYGSIVYASAGDNSANTKKGIEIIRNVVIGIIAYGVMYMVLNYLIPGGIFT